jgi:hypothetical protein
MRRLLRSSGASLRSRFGRTPRFYRASMKMCLLWSCFRGREKEGSRLLAASPRCFGWAAAAIYKRVCNSRESKPKKRALLK